MRARREDVHLTLARVEYEDAQQDLQQDGLSKWVLHHDNPPCSGLYDFLRVYWSSMILAILPPFRPPSHSSVT